MKKYVKPEVLFEKFEVSQQIATCEYDSKNTMNDSGCVFTGPNPITGETTTIFLDSTSACVVPTDDFCYHGSTGGYFNIFNS